MKSKTKKMKKPEKKNEEVYEHDLNCAVGKNSIRFRIPCETLIGSFLKTMGKECVAVFDDPEKKDPFTEQLLYSSIYMINRISDRHGFIGALWIHDDEVETTKIIYRRKTSEIRINKKKNCVELINRGKRN